MPPVLSIIKEPRCLIESGLDGKMAVNTDVLNELKSIDKHVVVVSIAGPYRTGKSYLMNKLYGQNKGFSLGATVQSHTKGIWIWVREHPIQKENYLVLLDTEGLGDVEKGDENHDNQILCLAILLASTFVYNVMGVIGNDAIEKLHFIAELAKHMQVRSKDSAGKFASDGDDSNFDFYFPDFVYAIRDFTLELKITGKEVTSDEYIEHVLTAKTGDRPEVKNFNKIRLCIRKYFTNRKCFTFVPPVAGRCRLLDDVPDDKLPPEFREETEIFVNHIHGNARVKQIDGRKLTGSMLGSLVEVYVDQMRTGIPHVENAVDTMARLENRRAKDDAVALYYRLMLESLTMPVLEDDDFSCCHNNCLAQAIDHFLSKSVFDNNHDFQEQLNKEIEGKYKELVDTNEEFCHQKCQEALNELYEPIQKKLREGHYTKSGGFRIYKDDMKLLEEKYQQQNGRLAVKMRHVLLEFLHARQTEEDAILQSDQMVTAKEKEREVERQKAIEMEQRKKEAERHAELQQKMLEEQQKAHQQNIERLEKKMSQDAEAAREHYEKTIQNRLNEQARLLSEGFSRESEQMKARIRDLESQWELMGNESDESDDSSCRLS